MSNENLLHDICDSDALWGPLVLLRPPREKQLGSGRLLLMCSLYGLFYGMCANAVFAIAHHFGGRATPPAYLAPLILMLGSFVCGELGLARAWNRRARLLARRIEWEQTIAARDR